MVKQCGICHGLAKLRWKQLGYICWFCELDFKHRFGRWMRKHEATSILHRITMTALIFTSIVLIGCQEFYRLPTPVPPTPTQTIEMVTLNLQQGIVEVSMHDILRVNAATNVLLHDQWIILQSELRGVINQMENSPSQSEWNLLLTKFDEIITAMETK